MDTSPIRAGDSIRLNLGGRGTTIPGFKTVDLKEGSEVVSDVSDLKGFADGSVSEIYASHILEHFGLNKTLGVLQEWRRVLKSGAKLYVAVPDFDAAVRLYQKEGFSNFLNHLLWGDQEYDLAYHYSGFTFPFLSNMLIQAGFDDVKRISVMPYGIKDCSHLIDTIHRIPISLNVEAKA
jgi:predicted SAM-dependent methyltransferase